MNDRYRPANGCEGADFQELFCVRCPRDVNDDCPIIVAAIVYKVTDPEYPREWTYDSNGNPTCTAFEGSTA